jgi:hypothetical protein
MTIHPFRKLADIVDIRICEQFSDALRAGLVPIKVTKLKSRCDRLVRRAYRDGWKIAGLG